MRLDAPGAAMNLHPKETRSMPISRRSRPAIAEVKHINLALQGGGAHGAFTWGVLDRLLEEPRICGGGSERDEFRRDERGGDGPWAHHRRA